MPDGDHATPIFEQAILELMGDIARDTRAVSVRLRQLAEGIRDFFGDEANVGFVNDSAASGTLATYASTTEQLAEIPIEVVDPGNAAEGDSSPESISKLTGAGDSQTQTFGSTFDIDGRHGGVCAIWGPPRIFGVGEERIQRALRLVAATVGRMLTEHRDSERQRLVATVASIGWWEVDVTTGELRWSDEVFRLHGLAPGPVPDVEEALNYYHPADRAEIAAAVKKTMAGGPGWDLVLRIVTARGQTRWVHAAGQRVVAPNGRVQIVGTFRDVNAWKIADLERQRVVGDLERILDHIPAFVWFKDTSNRILHANRAAADAAGVAPSEMAGRPSSDFYPQAEKYFEADLEVMQSREPVLGIVEPVPGDDGDKIVRTDKVPVIGDDGDVTGILVVATDITKYHQVQEALAVSERRYRVLSEAISPITWTCDPVGRFIEPQKAWEQFTGQPLDEHCGLGWADMLHADDRSDLLAAWNRSVEMSTTYHTKSRVYSVADKAYRWCEVVAEPVLDSDGTVVEWSGALIDVHARELAERARDELRRRLDDMFANTPAVVFSKDPSGRYTLFNERFRALFRSQSKDLVGKLDAEAFSPELAAQLSLGDRRVIESGEPMEIEVQLMQPAGKREFLVTKFPLTSTQGNPIGIAAIGIDVTDRNRAEQALHTTNERLREIVLALDSADDSVFIFDRNPLRNVYFNDAAIARSGLSAETLKTQSPVDLLRDVSAAAFDQLLDQIVKRDGVSRTFRASHVRDGQADIAVDVSIRAVTGIPNRGNRFIGILRDVTAIVDAQRRLQRKNGELEEFVYTASHDLKSPLVTINGYVAHILSDLDRGDTTELRGFCERIRKAAFRLRGHVDDLLELSRIGRVGETPTVVQWDDAIAHVREALATDLDDAGVSLRCDFDPPTIRADRARVVQVLQNLLGNALKYGVTKSNAIVDVTTHRSDDAIVLTVADHGAGIPPKHRQRAFGLFERLRTDIPGSGVGLSIVRRVAEQYDGEAWITETAGGGTSVHVSFRDVQTPLPLHDCGKAAQ